MQLSSILGLRIHGFAAGDRWAGGAGADAVPDGSDPKRAVPALCVGGSDQGAVLGGRQLCATV